MIRQPKYKQKSNHNLILIWTYQKKNKDGKEKWCENLF